MFINKNFLSIFFFLASLFALSCSNNDDALVLNVSVTSRLSNDNPLIAFVDIATDKPARFYVEYGNDETGYFKTIATASKTDHSIPIVRLRAATLYNFTVFALNSDDKREVQYTGMLTSGPLPTDLELGFKATGTPTFDLALMDVSITSARKSHILIVDSKGQIVWYKYISEFPQSLNAIRQKENFNLVYILANSGIFEISPLGQKVNELPWSSIEDSHHELLIENQNSIIFLAGRVEKSESYEVPIRLSDIRRWDQTNNETVKLWDPLNYEEIDSIVKAIFHPIEKRAPDDHSNSLYIGRRGNILLSRRHLNEIVSIAPGWGEIEWRLGGANSTFAFENASDRFYAQHTPVETEEGNILVFDNGYGRPESEGGEYSRALELKLNFESNTAEKVWEFRPVEDIFAISQGGLQRYENGNTLVNFSRNETPHIKPVVLCPAQPLFHHLTPS